MHKHTYNFVNFIYIVCEHVYACEHITVHCTLYTTL